MSRNEFDWARELFGDPGEDPEARERMRARLRRAIDQETSRRARRGGGRWAAAAAVAAAAIALVVVLVLPSGTSAATELRRLGALTASVAGPDLGEGEYVLTRWEELRPEGKEFIGEGGSFTVLSRLQVSNWIAGDNSGVRRTEVLSSTFASPADRMTWVADGRPDILPRAGDVRIDRFGAGEAPWFETSELSADPDRLLEALASGAVSDRPSDDEEIFRLIGDFLAQGDAPQEIRSALFEVAARLDGVRLIGDATDPLGRRGLAVAVDGTSSRTQLVFDPATARLLANEQYELPPDGSPGPLISWIAPRLSTIVDTAPTA
jgi:hypothetical protein